MCVWMIRNVRGVISSTSCLSTLLEKEECDILIITDHKLKENTHNYLDAIHNEYACFVRLDYVNILYDNLAFTGEESVAIIYKKSLMFSVKEVTLACYNTRRITGIKLYDNSGNTYYIIGVHLPSDSNIAVYTQELNIRENLYTYYSFYGKVLIAGDFNGSLVDPCNTNLIKAELLSNFVSKYQLSIQHKDFKDFVVEGE